MGLFSKITDNAGGIVGGVFGGPLGYAFGSSDLGNQVQESLGLKKSPAFDVDPHMYDPYYNQALTDISNTGAGTQKMRDQIQGAAGSQLAGLADNSAQRKQQFAEDMNRSFGGAVQEKARAAGGTGTMAQVSRPSGAMADAYARATQRGYTDLYGQGIKDLQGIQGIQNNLQAQDYARGKASADIRTGQAKDMMAQSNTNQTNASNQHQDQQGKLMGTIGGIGKMFGLG